MRMRNPISEAMRFLSGKGEVMDNSRQVSQKEGKPGSLSAQKQIVTVTVVNCKDIVMPFGDSTKIAPFFSYQFYTFDARESNIAAGANPHFADTQTYSMLFDDGAMTYLETQPLEIYFIDDNAPFNGLERGGQSAGDAGKLNDMIGKCSIPLKDLTKGIGINGDFDIKGQSGDRVGKVTIRISIVDPAATTAKRAAEAAKDIKAQEKAAFNDGWEQDIIMRIARKLARLSIDVELMFGIFSRGTRQCTREDFKYCCL